MSERAWRLLVVPVAAVGIAVVARLLLTPWLDERTPFITLFFPVMVVAWAAGTAAAIVAIVLAILASVTLLAPPIGTLESDRADVLGTLLFGAVLAAIAALAIRARDRGRALEEQNAELSRLLVDNRSLLTLRDGFSGMLAHELRTPLTVILGGLRILRRRLGERQDELAQLTADMADEAEHLHRLVEDLLVVSRGEGAIHVAPEPVLVQRVLERATDRARRAHPALAIDIQGDRDPPPILGDALLLEQVFANLYSNAAKYAGESPRVTVSVEQAGSALLIRVTDDGRGFPPGSLRQLFTPFYRAPQSVVQASGAGVGLFVVKRLVEAMGGSVEATNAREGGASVTVSLPLMALDEEPEAYAAEIVGATPHGPA